MEGLQLRTVPYGASLLSGYLMTDGWLDGAEEEGGLGSPYHIYQCEGRTMASARGGRRGAKLSNRLGIR